MGTHKTIKIFIYDHILLNIYAKNNILLYIKVKNGYIINARPLLMSMTKI